MTGIELHSPAFIDHAYIPDRHARQGDNLSPALQWSGTPTEATTLLLLCSDPDAPPGPFLHWLVTGIDTTTVGIGEDEVFRDDQLWPNDFGDAGWGGPQPPPGDNAHRYFFQLYALTDTPRLAANPTVANVHAAVGEMSLASGTLVGLYQR